MMEGVNGTGPEETPDQEQVREDHSVTLRDVDGRPAYRLDLDEEGVRIWQLRISMKAPLVRADALREALRLLGVVPR
jgi:hypothetical protein